MNEKAKRTIEAIKEVAKKEGKWPSRNEWNRYTCESRHNYYSAEGLYYHTKKSWDIHRQEAGFPPRDRRYSKEECIQAIIKAAQELGEFFTRREYEIWQKQHPNMPTAPQISLRCKGFNGAKQLAGLIPNESWGKEFTDEEIRRALEKCAEEVGLLFSEEQYEIWRNGREEIPTIETVRKRMGGIPEAKRKLNMKTYVAGANPKYDDGRWRAPFMKFLAYTLNHNVYEEWAKENKGPSMKALSDHVGGYEKALLEMLPKYIEKIKSNRKNDKK